MYSTLLQSDTLSPYGRAKAGLRPGVGLHSLSVTLFSLGKLFCFQPNKKRRKPRDGDPLSARRERKRRGNN